jgi:phage terminase large subunit
LWKVFGLGLRGTSSETIYTHWKIVDEIPGKGERWYGQDFGYNVPSALIDLEYYEGGIYWDQLLYETKLTTGDLIERYKTIGVDSRKEIFCDNAEPKTIEELVRAGYNAKPADKDVTEGIRKVKSLPLYITKRSIETIKEAKSYKWKVDKNGRVLDEPVKFNDHAMDAGRYGTFTKLHKPKFQILI